MPPPLSDPAFHASLPCRRRSRRRGEIVMKSTVRGVGAKVSVGRFLAIAVAAAAVAVSVLPAASASAATRRVQVSAQTIGNNGKVLVSNGRALYFLVAPGTCDSSCLAIWPALTVPAHVKASAGSGVRQHHRPVGYVDGRGREEASRRRLGLHWFEQQLGLRWIECRVRRRVV